MSLPVSFRFGRGRTITDAQIAPDRYAIHAGLHRSQANTAAIVKCLHEMSVLVLGDQDGPAYQVRAPLTLTQTDARSNFPRQAGGSFN